MKLAAVLLIGIVIINLWYQSELRVKITKIITQEDLKASDQSLNNVLQAPVFFQALPKYESFAAIDAPKDLNNNSVTPSLESQQKTIEDLNTDNPQQDLPKQDLKSQLSKVTLISLWASWCPTCKEEFPEIETLQNQWKDSGFKVISINCDAQNEQAKALEIFKTFQVHFPVVFDEKGELVDQFQVEVLPTHFLVSETGDILLRLEGATQWKHPKIQALIKELL